MRQRRKQTRNGGVNVYDSVGGLSVLPWLFIYTLTEEAVVTVSYWFHTSSYSYITTFTDCWLPVSNDLLNRLIGSLSASQSVWQRYRLVTQKPLPLKPVTWLKHRPSPEADHSMLPPTTPLPKNPWWLHDTQACYRKQNALKAAELWVCYPE